MPDYWVFSRDYAAFERPTACFRVRSITVDAPGEFVLVRIEPHLSHDFRNLDEKRNQRGFQDVAAYAGENGYKTGTFRFTTSYLVISARWRGYAVERIETWPMPVNIWIVLHDNPAEVDSLMLSQLFHLAIGELYPTFESALA